MRTTVAIGLILVIAGALAMVLQLAGVFGDSASLAIGNLEIEASTEPRMEWLPWAAGASVILGVILMVTGRRG